MIEESTAKLKIANKFLSSAHAQYASDAYPAHFSRTMALYRFFQRKEWPVVPTLSLCGTSSLSRKELERANDRVSHALCPGVGAGESAISTPRAHYNDYTDEERAQIGKYAILFQATIRQIFNSPLKK